MCCCFLVSLVALSLTGDHSWWGGSGVHAPKSRFPDLAGGHGGPGVASTACTLGDGTHNSQLCWPDSWALCPSLAARVFGRVDPPSGRRGVDPDRVCDSVAWGRILRGICPEESSLAFCHCPTLSPSPVCGAKIFLSPLPACHFGCCGVFWSGDFSVCEVLSCACGCDVFS